MIAAIVVAILIGVVNLVAHQKTIVNPDAAKQTSFFFFVQNPSAEH